MCGFCEKIIKTDKEYFDARVNGGDFIFQNEELFCVLIDTGDSGCLGCLNDIKYCPICGRNLTGKENKVNDTITKEIIRLKKELDTFINCLLPRATIQAGEEIKKGNYNLVTIVTNGERREQKEILDKIAKLEDRHQSDCITINQLQTTIDVLVDKLARLREVHGL